MQASFFTFWQVVLFHANNNLALGPALASYRSFTLGFPDGQVYYGVVDEVTGDWEIGLGTLSGGGATLARNTVYSSSNANALVNFAAGTKIVYAPVPAYAHWGPCWLIHVVRASSLAAAGAFPPAIKRVS